jgi:hypothetical protein
VSARPRFRLTELDLSAADRCAARRQYRTLRIAQYAPQTSPFARDGMYQGHYGMGRDQAKAFIRGFYEEVSWREYVGSK